MEFKDVSTVLNDFLNYLQYNNYSQGTILMYKEDLKDFFLFIKFYKKIKIDIINFTMLVFLNIKKEDIVSYLVFLNYTKENMTSTRYRKYSAIKCFYKWLLKNNPGHDDPTGNLLTQNKVIRIPKHLTLEESKKIQTVFNNSNSKYPIRNNAIINLFLATGIRINELVNINIEDINFANNSIIIKRGKGNKTRIVYFSNLCKKQLLLYLNTKGKIVNLKYPLFSTHHYKYSERMNINTVRAVCKNAYKLIGIENKHYTPHTLRHTSATIMYKYVKQDILLIKEFLGHKSLLATEIYTHVDNDTIRKAVESNPLSNYIPINKKIA